MFDRAKIVQDIFTHLLGRAFQRIAVTAAAWGINFDAIALYGSQAGKFSRDFFATVGVCNIVLKHPATVSGFATEYSPRPIFMTIGFMRHHPIG